jgi:hypothetical protein
MPQAQEPACCFGRGIVDITANRLSAACLLLLHRSELIPATLALERPATSDRQRGRVPLTVLDPAASAGHLTSTVTAVTVGSDRVVQHPPLLQQQSTPGSTATSTSGAQDTGQLSRVPEEQVLLQTGHCTDEKMSLKVNVAAKPSCQG